VAEEKLEFSLGAHGDATVYGWDGLIRWVEKERAKWAWLVPGDGRTDVHSIASTVQNGFNGIMNGIASVRDSGQPLSNARDHLVILANGTLLPSESPDGALILDVREHAGDVAAAFAYAFIRQQVTFGSARTREELLGAMLTVVPTLGDATAFAARLQQERANYRSSLRSAIDHVEGADRDRNAAFDALVSRGKRIANRTLWRNRDSWRRVQKNWQSQATQAVSDIRGTEAAFLEAMHLQAPVKYWSDKAAGHRKKEMWGIGRLVVFFPLAFGLLGWAFWKSATYLLAHASTPGATTPTPLYVIITGGLVVLSTLLFWIGRLLTKLYLSEHHLRNDAEERAIMTQTYLALTKEAAASDTDRNIVLTAIFRNTPDGIVKDDGPGDVSLQALLSRFATSMR
jgi:hypothetical protein